jgi:AbrB family looped-hinge helix DNA binding protein
MKATMDAAGRLVIPKSIRRQAGIGPHTEFEVRTRGAVIELRPIGRTVRLEARGSLVVAVPAEEGSVLRQTEVDATVDALRRRAVDPVEA